jgi:hypothetical protein
LFFSRYSLLNYIPGDGFELISAFYFFVLSVLGFEIKAYTLSHSSNPFFCIGYFQDRVLQTICSGWPWTTVLLISVSWVVRIIGMSHGHPAIIHIYV